MIHMNSQALTQLTQSLGIGRAILSDEGEIVEANESARESLGRLRLNPRALLRGQPPIDATLIRRLKGWTSLRIDVKPGPVVIHHRSLTAGGGCLLMILDPQVLPDVSSDLLRQIFGLTPAEGRVAQLVMSGATCGMIADALKVGSGTARTHMKALYLKTGTHRQPELTALLWRMCFLPQSARADIELAPQKVVA